MKTIYHVYYEGYEDGLPETGEIEGMIDSDGNLLGAWAANDGTWRGEYFDGFMEKLGIEVLSSWDQPGHAERLNTLIAQFA